MHASRVTNCMIVFIVYRVQITHVSHSNMHIHTYTCRYKQPDLNYDISVYAVSLHNELDVFENVGSWDFPIFDLEGKAGDHILSHVSLPAY